MADREKVIKAIDYCTAPVCDKEWEENDYNCPHYECPYFAEYKGGACISAMLKDALELLKEHEAVVPVLVHEGANKQRNDYKCPKCHTRLYYDQRYCEWCGRKVDWE